MKARPIAIIGAGVVGTSVGQVLESRGYKIAAVAARNQASINRVSVYINARATTDIIEAAKMGELIFITTPDDKIQEVTEEIARSGGFDVNDIVFHMSGALPLDVLDAAKAKGAQVGSIHPMQTFAAVDGAIAALPGSVFGVTAADEALSVAQEIVKALGGEMVVIADKDKTLYHAAAVAVSNYLITLVHYGEGLYNEIGIPEEMARRAFIPLLKGTVINLVHHKPASALTGPIARGDVGTVRRHLAEIEKVVPQAAPLYRVMGAYTVKVATEKGTIDETTAHELLRTLRGGEND